MAGILDFLSGIFGGDSSAPPGLLASAPQPAGGPLTPPQIADPLTGMTPSQQKWSDALGGLGAALRDAGAYLQHRPEAANNVADFTSQQHRQLQDAIGQTNYNNMLLGLIARSAPGLGKLFSAGLPPAAAAWLLLQRAQEPRTATPGEAPSAAPPGKT